MKNVISKTGRMNKKGWLLTKEEVESKVKEFLKLDKNAEITRIDGFQVGYVRIYYSEKPEYVKKEDLVYEQEIKRKRVVVSDEKFLELFGIKPVYQKTIAIEGKIKKDGMFLQSYEHPSKYVFPEKDMFYFFAIEDPYYEIIEEENETD